MKILVGFDDSKGAWDAIALARTFCGVTGAEALLVQVLSEEQSLPVPRYNPDAESVCDSLRTQLDQKLSEPS